MLLIQWFYFKHASLQKMIKLKTKLTFDVSLELMRIKETAKTISKVLKVAKEITRTRLLKR